MLQYEQSNNVTQTQMSVTGHILLTFQWLYWHYIIFINSTEYRGEWCLNLTAVQKRCPCESKNSKIKYCHLIYNNISPSSAERVLLILLVHLADNTSVLLLKYLLWMQWIHCSNMKKRKCAVRPYLKLIRDFVRQINGSRTNRFSLSVETTCNDYPEV